MNTIFNSDCIEGLKKLPPDIVNTCVTSPPYFGLRDYGVSGQIGLEPTPQEFVKAMVSVFREVKRVLRDDGTLWLNLGDSYSHGGCGSRDKDKWPKQSSNDHMVKHQKTKTGVPPKSLMGIPWKVAFALQDDGWYLRSDVIWNKPNPMPESCKDRPTRSHEYIFLLSKSAKYYYDFEAIKEKSTANKGNAIGFRGGAYCNNSTFENGKGGNRTSVGNTKPDKQRGHSRRHAGVNERWDSMTKEEQCSGYRNKRDVWTVATRPFPESHFATFPPELIRPCILAGSPAGGLVLDPFMGAGTTALVSLQERRNYIGFELNPKYIDIANKRISIVQSKLF